MLKEGKQFYQAVSILVGTVIGAGIFGLPYAIAQIGFLPGMIYLTILAIVVLICLLCYGEVVLRTKEQCQMSGYAKKYLGQWGKRLITISLILGIYGALLAYTIGVGNFLFAVISPYLGGSALIYSVIFWFLASLIVWRGLGIIASIELFMVGLLVFVVFFVSGLSIFKIEPANLFYFNLKNMFFPFGVILFALGGATAIPNMKDILKKKTNLLKKAIFFGIIIPVVVYFLFSFAVIGISGRATSEQAVEGLALVLGQEVLFLGAIFGTIAMATSFLALAYVLREMFEKDFRVPHFYAIGLTCLIPLIIFLLGWRNFIQVVAISGSILGGFQGIILILMYYRAKKRNNRVPEYSFNLPKVIGSLVCSIFVLGIVYQIYYLFFS